MRSSHTFTVDSAVFDERNLVSAAGLVPVLELAEQTGLSELIGEHVQLPSTRVEVGGGEPGRQVDLDHRRHGVRCDCIDDVDVLRAGGTPRVFDEVYAPSTLGIFLREFTFGHANQLAAVHRQRLVALAQRVPLLAASSSARFWTSTRCCARSTGQPSRAPRSGMPRSPAGRCCAGSVAADHHDLDGDRAAGDRRGAAALGAGRLRARRRRQVKQAITTARKCGPARSCCAATRRSAPRR